MKIVATFVLLSLCQVMALPTTSTPNLIDFTNSSTTNSTNTDNGDDYFGHEIVEWIESHVLPFIIIVVIAIAILCALCCFCKKLC